MSQSYTTPNFEDFVRETLDLGFRFKRQVTIYYIDKKGNPERRVVEPFEFNETNFGGYCHLRDSWRNFSYNRIVRIGLSDLVYVKSREDFPPRKTEAV